MDIAQVKPVRAARLLFQLPRDCRVFTKLEPQNQWGWSEIFANKTNYLLEMLLWQNSYDPKKKSQSMRNKPKPFIPDFMKAKPTDDQKRASKGSVAMPVDDIKSWLAQPRGV